MKMTKAEENFDRHNNKKKRKKNSEKQNDFPSSRSE